jgi:hypothetical protein
VVTDWFDIDGYVLGVRTTSHVFSEWLRSTMSTYVIDKPDDKDDEEALYSVVFEDGLNPSGRVGSKKFHMIYYGTWDIVRTLDPMAVGESLLHEIDSFTFPVRDDAVFVEASILRLDGKTVLIPAIFVKPLADIGRRLQQHLDIQLPGVMSLAVDPATGMLVPPAQELTFAEGWREGLERLAPNAGSDPRAMVWAPTAVDLIVGWMSESYAMVRKGPRGPALYAYTKMIRNHLHVGSTGLSALGKVFEAAEYRELQYFSWREAVEAFNALSSGTDYVADRTEATPGTP